MGIPVYAPVVVTWTDTLGL